MVHSAPRVERRAGAPLAGLHSAAYFVWVTLAMLALIILGFGPGWIQRSREIGPPLQPVVSAHGALMFLWIVLMLVQSSLVARKRIGLHRFLGISAIPLVLVIVATGLLVTVNKVKRSAVFANGILANANELSAVFWLNFCLMAVFLLVISTALTFRRQPDIHMRLVTIAGFGLMPVPIAHIVGEGSPLVPLLLVVLMATLFLHDWLTARRVHRVSWLGCTGFLAVVALFRFVIADSEPGRLLVVLMV